MRHPYEGIAPFQRWRTAVSTIDPHSFDPVTSPRFRITRSDMVASAGSCFAQRISAQLSRCGFNHFIVEDGKELPPAERLRRGYGIFSARYGNIYTVRHLLQLFREAVGTRRTSEPPWMREDGRYVDPFRPTVEPDGFSSPEEVIAARREHLAAVRRMFEEMDVFVFTAGMTEGWLNGETGDVFPLAPGVAGGEYDPSRHRFVNYTVFDVIADLREFLFELKAFNPKVKVLLTVSPVSYIATYEKRNVVVSTVYSKSVLRVAVETMVQEFDWVEYLPTYEIVVSNVNPGKYLEEDLREVNSLGITHVMRCFTRNFLEGGDLPDSDDTVSIGGVDDEVICDERLLDLVAS